MPTLDPFLLDVVACPACHGPLAVADDRLTCAACGLWYPIVDEIPVLLASEARTLDASEPSGDPTDGEDA